MLVHLCSLHEGKCTSTKYIDKGWLSVVILYRWHLVLFGMTFTITIKIPTFRPNALALFRVKKIQKTCTAQTTPLISILHTFNYERLFGKSWRCSTLSVATQQAGNSRPPSLLKRWFSGVRLMYKASLIINSFLLLAWSNTVVSLHSILWSVAHKIHVIEKTTYPFSSGNTL